MIIWLDASIGIFIIFITITPFIWDGKKRNIILIISALICIGLYLFQGFSKYKEVEEFGKMKTKIEKIDSWFNKLNQEGKASANTLLDRYLQKESKEQRWGNVLKLSELMLAIDNNNQSALNFRGEYERKYQSDCPKAILWYEKSLAVNPNNKYAADAWVYLGICKYNQGQKKEALECFKKAVSIDKYYKDATWWVDKIQSEIQ